MKISPQSAMALASLLAGGFTGFAALLMLVRYIDAVKSSNMHDGMSFMWTVYSLVGVGLLIGLAVNLVLRLIVHR